MKNGIFKLDWATIGDAVLTAVVTAIVVGLYGVVTTAGFNVFTADWVSIGQNMVNLGFIAGVVSFGKDFLSTNNGSLLAVGPEAPTPTN